MKIFKFLSLVCVLSLVFSSCETYGDPEVEYSAIFPMSGEWVVMVKDLDADTIIKLNNNNKTVMYTYNTANESIDQMWLRIGTATSSNARFGARGKVDINLGARTFSGTDIQNEYLSSTSKFSVTSGKVLLEQARPISGGVADSIYFELTLDRSPGKRYALSGYRRTGWPEDEPK